jgi:hypothetical protein
MFRTHSALMGVFIFGCSYCFSDYSKNFWLWDDRACLIDETDYLEGGAVARQGNSTSRNSSQVLIQVPIDPWTNVPSCSRTYGNQYCTFTDSKFSNGRGITIITTPDIAAELSTLTALVENSSLQRSASQPYVAQNIPGKGVGLVATRTLFTGDMIFAHPPASLHHNGIFQSMPWREKEFVIRESINSLPSETRKMWWDLDWQGSRDDLVEDIINTNSFKVFLGSNKTLHSMMSPEMSVSFTLLPTRPNSPPLELKWVFIRDLTYQHLKP